MPNKITNEDIISYLDKECEESLKLKIDEAIKNDETIRERYNELKGLRMLQAETMLPLLNKQMPESTAKIINSLKEKKTSYISNFFKLSPIAIIGWLGFASVGTMQVASVMTPSATISIASLENDEGIKYRSATMKEDISDIILKLEEELLIMRGKLNDSEMSEERVELDAKSKASNVFLEIPKPQYTFNILEIFKNNDDICVEFEALEEEKLIDTKEVCFNQK